MQITRAVPEGCRYVPEVSGAETLWDSGGFWCGYLVRFRKFLVQIPGFRGVQVKMSGEVPEGSGQTPSKVPEGSVCKVPEGFGADTW